MHRQILFALSLFTFTAQAQLLPDGSTASFKGSLPPKAAALISGEQKAALEKQLTEVTEAFQGVKKHARAADADIFLKAVRYALEFEEWYDKKPEDGVKKARALLEEASRRITALKADKTPWMEGSGMKVLGFYSAIDDSPQPYGVEVPEGLQWGDGKKAVPMWIWLHGRGDTTTDLHFVYSRLMAKKRGEFQPRDTIVIHPFGRYCNGWKSAGETDVFEARDDAKERFNVDENRIALAGFSMGGAGAWHIGAHFADQWACVHTGAGFVDVKRYLKLTPEKYPVSYEQTLWGVYDVPDYARNFFNVPLISYSGELDSQRDSAEYMMEVLGKEGLKVPHLIGPGMPHKYHPETIKEVQELVEAAVAKGRDPMPKKVTLQTRCTRYGKMFWVKVGALQRPWEDTRVDAEILDAKKVIRVTTKNVSVLVLDLPTEAGGAYHEHRVMIDGTFIPTASRGYVWDADTKVWRSLGRNQLTGAKGGEDDGIIDQAFQERFTIVLPDGPCANPAVDAWVKSESQHFIQRWRMLMRGDPLVKKPSELTGKDEGRLCVWGDPKGNSYLAKSLAKLPFTWTDAQIEIAGQRFDAKTHVPVMSVGWSDHHNTMQLVINSGLTFREAHDKTNSLQNPKLPDWAILDITVPPSAEAAGKVVAAHPLGTHSFVAYWRTFQSQ